jgi:hypothetical protein
MPAGKNLTFLNANHHGVNTPWQQRTFKPCHSHGFQRKKPPAFFNTGGRENFPVCESGLTPAGADF